MNDPIFVIVAAVWAGIMGMVLWELWKERDQ